MAYSHGLNGPDDEEQPNSTEQIAAQVTPPDQNSPDYQGQTQQPQQAGPVWNKDARNQFRDAWMSQGGSYGGDIQRFINEKFSPYASQFRVDGDKVYINPTVDDRYGSMGQEVIDLVGDYGPGGQNSATWTGIGPGSGSAGNDVYPNGAPQLAGGNGAYTPGQSGPTGMQDPRSSALFDLLMQRAQQSSTIDRNDPNVRAQSDAFNAQGQQARRDFLAAQAEKAGPYGNQTSEERRSAEELGKTSGAFEAQAIANKENARRQEIESALSGAAGFLTEQQRMALQKELQQMSLAQQESQFGRNLEQNSDQFNKNLGQNAWEFDINRYDNIFG